MLSNVNETQTTRNGEIWHANRAEGIGTAKLAASYGLSRQRIRQIIAREDQRIETRSAPAPTKVTGSEGRSDVRKAS